MIKFLPQTPKQALNKAFLKQRPLRKDIDLFKENLIRLLGKVDEIEREENQKNHIRDFLRDTFYKENNEINTKDTKDLVIHLGKTNKEKVGVIIEAKRPSNKGEMPAAMITEGKLTITKINSKSLHELILYYFDERTNAGNHELKQLVITNVYEWYIIDANYFDKVIYRNTKIKKLYETYRSDKKDTPFFYEEVSKLIPLLDSEIPVTYFDIRDYKKFLLNADKADDRNLIALFKILSPYHLLKQPFANDSNSLDKTFYTELLHIIGLTEIKDGGKKVIQRPAMGQRNSGSLLENAITQLDSLDKVGRLDNPGQYGATYEDRLFNVGLELVITWINRVLFLKLLEAQLVGYHKGDAAYAFLNFNRIQNYDDLNSLFFSVLARRPDSRVEEVRAQFEKVPYLNSSLFELTSLENQAIVISNLRDERTLPVLSGTVLKNEFGKKQSGSLNTIAYLFAFMESYDFASEGSEDIQEQNKTLINASVLGLIFEKINGYKDGSFFTPGFITMYMCRETIRRTVVQKMNEYLIASGHQHVKPMETLDDVYNQIGGQISKKSANEVINSIRICDPAVGSGHFLVSALNEIISIKSYLKVLQDKNGLLLRDYHVDVENDELTVADDEGNAFVYKPHNKESQRIQETLFHEKQTIIENCLFGVDINPNSVKICRLRLWIELLKNAYYKAETNFTELETLPNIDINIKCGNSLISRFALDADLKQALRNSKGPASRWTIDTYKIAVQTYRNAQSKEEKREMERLIEDIKGNFRSEIGNNDPKVKKLSRASGELYNLLNQSVLFEPGKAEKKKKKLLQEKLETEITHLSNSIEEIKSNKIYENAFEWRFEFPDVLNDDGDFMGFDVVIGNPPYVFARENFDQHYKDYYYENYKGIDYQVNLYVLFAELSIKILQPKGNYSLIVPNTLLMVNSTSKIRKLLFTNAPIIEVVNFLGESFEGVNVETVAFFGVKNKIEEYIKVSIGEKGIISFSHTKRTETILNSPDLVLNVFSGDYTDNLLTKIISNTTVLDELVQIKAGLQAYEVGKGNPKQSREDVSNRIYDFNHKVDETTFPYLEGKDVQRYFQGPNTSFLKYGDNLAASRTFDIFSSPKIIIREITSQHPHSIIACYSDQTMLFNRSNIAVNKRENTNIDLKYVLAVINSRLMSYYFQLNTAKAVRKLFPKIILNDLRRFPIKAISKEEQSIFISLVDQIISLKNHSPSLDTSNLESQIDQLVYALYELTEEEIAIVEGRG